MRIYTKFILFCTFLGDASGNENRKPYWFSLGVSRIKKLFKTGRLFDGMFGIWVQGQHVHWKQEYWQLWNGDLPSFRGVKERKLTIITVLCITSSELINLMTYNTFITYAFSFRKVEENNYIRLQVIVTWITSLLWHKQNKNYFYLCCFYKIREHIQNEQVR